MKLNGTSSRGQSIYKIALAGICASLALLFVYLSSVVRVMTLTFDVAAAISLMVPITRRYYTSGIFAYMVSAGLSVLVAGDIFLVIGYIAYFGPMTLISCIMTEHGVKPYISIPIKLVLMETAIALLYFLGGTLIFAEQLLEKLHFAWIAVIGGAALLAIDLLIAFLYIRVKPIVSKALKLPPVQPKEKTPKEKGQGGPVDVQSGNGQGEDAERNLPDGNSGDNPDDNPFEY